MALIRINPDPGNRQLAVFALAWLALLGRAAWVLAARGHAGAAAVVGVAAAAVPLCGLVNRALVRAVYLGTSRATYPVGLVVSHILLGLVYYGVLTPVGLVLRLTGHDPLGRRFDRAAPSYWRRRAAAPDTAAYFRQG